MPIYIGLHTFLNDDLYIEIGEYDNIEEAYEDMERNDSNLCVISLKELKKISNIVISSNVKFNKLIRINE